MGYRKTAVDGSRPINSVLNMSELFLDTIKCLILDKTISRRMENVLYNMQVTLGYTVQLPIIVVMVW